MLRDEWNALFQSLTNSRNVIAGWERCEPDPQAARCEQSRHRTLAHLRACQEQWLVVANEFIVRDNPSVTILHPWRKFEQNSYAALPWDDHLSAFLADRETWLALQDAVDWNRGGKMNRRPDSIGGLTKRLAQHEAYHVGLLV